MNRSYINRGFIFLSKAATLICLAILLFLLARITFNGIAGIDFTFLLSPSKNFGTEGGILYQITGTLLIISFAGFIGLPLGLATAIFQSEYIKNPILQKTTKILIYGLNGVPSIIFGIFGLILFVNILDTGISWIIGSVILSFMILPTIILASYQSIHSIPQSYRENASALGLNQWQTILSVLIPQGFGGAITGLLLGLARAAGEIAPIMFIATAFSGAEIPRSFFEPVATLPTHILALAQQATDPQALQNAWAASLVLLTLVMILNGLGLYSRIKFNALDLR